MRKFSGGMAVEVLENEPKTVSSKFVPNKIADRKVSNDQYPALKRHKPRMIWVVTFEFASDFMGFLQVMAFTRFPRFDDAKFAHSFTYG